MTGNLFPNPVPAFSVDTLEMEKRLKGVLDIYEKRAAAFIICLGWRRMLILLFMNAIQKTFNQPETRGVILILSTTKGNIDLFWRPAQGRSFDHKRVYLWAVGAFWGFLWVFNTPLIISKLVFRCYSPDYSQPLWRAGKLWYCCLWRVAILSRNSVISGFQSFRHWVRNHADHFIFTERPLAGEGCGPFVLSTNPEDGKRTASLSWVGR